MKLHGYNRSSTTYRVRIALALKGLDYQTVQVNLLANSHNDPEFALINPFSTVPVLEIDERCLVQSMAILASLDERFPDPPLLPNNSADRHLCREVSFAIATDIHALNNLTVLKYLKADFHADESQIAKWYAHWIHRTFAPVEQKLLGIVKRGQLPFLDQPSLFECVLIPQMFNARRFQIDLKRYPRLLQIENICLQLPEFRSAHPDNHSDTKKSN